MEMIDEDVATESGSFLPRVWTPAFLGHRASLMTHRWRKLLPPPAPELP
jgi:hypothetical protein